MEQCQPCDGIFRVYCDISLQEGNCGYACSILRDQQPFVRESGRLLKVGRNATLAELAAVLIALRCCPDGANVLVSCDISEFPQLICTPRPSKVAVPVEVIRVEAERFSSCRFIRERGHPEYQWCHRRAAVARKRKATDYSYRVYRNPPRIVRVRESQPQPA